MQSTTPPAPPSLESVTDDLLQLVSGGCHKHRCCCPCPQLAPQPCVTAAPQAAPVALPQALPQPAPAGDLVSTTVNITGQPQAMA